MLGYLGIWGETRLNYSLEQSISRQKGPGMHSSFAMNWLNDFGYSLFIIVTYLRLKLCNLVSLAENINQ